MKRYRISQRAEQDLEDIWIYIAQTDQIAADLLLAKILDKLPMLASFPEMRKKRDSLLKGLKSFPVKPYIVFYARTKNGIEIFRILHQSRDFESQF